MTDIFDLEQLDDVPSEIQGTLQVTKRDEFETNLIELFSIANRPLNLDEVIVGYYRKFAVAKERTKINTKLNNMARGTIPAVVSVPGKKGVYELAETFRKKNVDENKNL